jgi:hypothetical protein
VPAPVTLAPGASVNVTATISATTTVASGASSTFTYRASRPTSPSSATTYATALVY